MDILPARGLPMIVTDVGGHPEAVADGENRRVIPPRDTAALARATIDLHGNPARAAAMGRVSRTRVEERFSLERMCAEHVQLYRSWCASSRIASGLSAGAG
jgi:glycosyltransferase involved in cell wall biosynthesis